jgi:Uma2 family endonuclease
MTAMTVQADTTRITADEFLSQDYPTGSELVNGVVHLIDPSFRHQEICSQIYQALFLWTIGEHGHGRIGWGGNWVLSDLHVYKPDVWWDPTPPEGVRHEGPPALAVEVRSPKTWHLDIGAKRDEYRRSGVRELWLVDTPARVVLVYREGRTLDEALELGSGEELQSPLLSGFSLPLDVIFAE